MTERPDPNAFTVERAEVRNGVSLAYVHEGAGGTPIVLIHGYPETKRIWWRNIGPLADAGFEVIAPDLRGYGDSDLAADGFYDVTAYSLDLYALVHDVLGHDRCTLVGGDLGGVVLYDLALRYPGFVERLCVFNTLVILRDELFEAAGIPPDDERDARATADYFRRQGKEPEALIAELDTPARRRAWVAGMYGHRLWAAPGHFGPDDVDFMTEPFADADRPAPVGAATRPRTATDPWRTCRSSSSRARCLRSSCTARRTTWSRRGFRPGHGSPSRTASARSSSPMPATSCSGNRRTCSTGRSCTIAPELGRPVTAQPPRSCAQPGT